MGCRWYVANSLAVEIALRIWRPLSSALASTSTLLLISFKLIPYPGSGARTIWSTLSSLSFSRRWSRFKKLFQICSRWSHSRFLYRRLSWMRDLKASSRIPTRLLVRMRIPIVGVSVWFCNYCFITNSREGNRSMKYHRNTQAPLGTQSQVHFGLD